MTEQTTNTRYDSAILKERLKTFYKCRDLEITNLWQRSIFLGAFLLLCFTGYGYMLFSLKSHTIGTHIYGFLLAIIGMVMSIIWILMGKGSKRWYEVYEWAICDIEAKTVLRIPYQYQMGNYCANSDTDDCIFSLNAGKYSPSKLNICIGHISLYIWGFIFCIHGGMVLLEYFVCLSYYSFALSASCAITIATIAVFVLKRKSRSGC